MVANESTNDDKVQVMRRHHEPSTTSFILLRYRLYFDTVLMHIVVAHR